MSHCFHVQNQHTDTFLAPAVDMLVILAPHHPPKYQNDHQWIGSQFNRHNAGTVSAAPQRPNVKSTSGWTAACSQFVGRGAMLSYNSPSLNFSTTLDQRRQKFLDGRRQPRCFGFFRKLQYLSPVQILRMVFNFDFLRLYDFFPS